MVGEPGEAFFGTIHADLCFIGTYAISGDLLTDATMDIAATKRTMIRSARRTIVLADSSKFRAPAFTTFTTLSEIEEVVTDDGVSAEVRSSLGSLGTKMTIVPVGISSRPKMPQDAAVADDQIKL